MYACDIHALISIYTVYIKILSSYLQILNYYIISKATLLKSAANTCIFALGWPVIPTQKRMLLMCPAARAKFKYNTMRSLVASGVTN